MIRNGHAGFGRGVSEKDRKAPRRGPTSADEVLHPRNRLGEWLHKEFGLERTGETVAVGAGKRAILWRLAA